MANIIVEKPKTSISTKLLENLKTEIHAQGQVVIHILFVSLTEPTCIRIWPSTYLYDNNSSHISDLLHVENISIYPEWTLCAGGKEHCFTLIFKGLPKSCTNFRLLEHCTNQPGAFEINDIRRNDSDVYYFEMQS